MPILYTGTILAAAQLTRAAALNLTDLLAPVAPIASFRNTGTELLAVAAGGSVVTVSEWIGTTIEGQPADPRTVSLAAGKVSLLGPWPRVYDQQDFTVHLSFSDNTGVSAALLQMPGLS